MLTANAGNSSPLGTLESRPLRLHPCATSLNLPTPGLGSSIRRRLDSCWLRRNRCDKVTQSLIEILKGIYTKLVRISRKEQGGGGGNTKGLTSRNFKLVLHNIRYIEKKRQNFASRTRWMTVETNNCTAYFSNPA